MRVRAFGENSLHSGDGAHDALGPPIVIRFARLLYRTRVAAASFDQVADAVMGDGWK
ncbi:MAG TPA: hypothetical protein VIW73_06940 [Candidatus Cybelea sp.]